MRKFTHLDEKGRAKMVDVTDKRPTKRFAKARGKVKMRPETLSMILSGSIEKGDVLGVARVAGIMAAKEVPRLVPLCHPLNLTDIEISFSPDKADTGVVIDATTKLVGVTGAEMEALTAVAVTALTIYDMCKAVDKEMIISDIHLISKKGGKSGSYKRKKKG